MSMWCFIKDSLEEQSTQVGFGVTISQYYRRASRGSGSSSTSITQQQLIEIIRSHKEEVKNEIGEENKQNLEKLKQEILLLLQRKQLKLSKGRMILDDPLCDLIKCLYDIYEKHVELLWNGTKFEIPNVDASFFLTYSDANEMISCDKCLNIAILQLWIMFMDDWSCSLGHGSVYGFLEPQLIHNANDRCVECQHYIENWVKESQREVYLGAYLNQ
ncbi:hypothetical protein GmHk_01G000601 [Glycine max]|nr:hypothetical protein GmHk_01G000601 [Glycine max]